MFKKAYVEISDICGLKCSFCPALKGKRGNLELGLFERICKELQGRCERMALHILGDPLRNPKLLKYLQIASRYQHRIEIVTSGFYLHLWEYQLLLQEPIVQINFSLSAYTDTKIQNQDYLLRCLEFAKFHQQSNAMIFLNLRMHKSRLHWELARKICAYFDIECQFHQNRIRLGKYLFLTLSKDFEWIDSSRVILQQKKFCYGLSKQIGVLSDGRVVPCCIDCEGKITLGQIKTQSLDEILASSLAQKIIQGFQKHQAYHLQCQKCTYSIS